MCGFAGWVGDTDDALLERMNRAQRHRGPDGEGRSVDARDRVSMIACRLAIVDAAGGAQPMSDPARGVTLVYTGEVVNAPELRRTLAGRGHVFRSSHSDTEVVLRAYLEYGDDLVERLNGMFAFVIHDARRQRLFGAVDRFAIKPLYVAARGSALGFATELKSLLALPWVDRRLDRQALYDAMSFDCVPAPRSIVAGVGKLGAAQSFSFDTRRGGLAVRTYWTPTIADTAAPSADEPGERAGLAERCRAAIDAAARRWSVADVPIGIALSGGVDSSALVALAAGRGANGAPIKTYFAGLDGDPADGRERARAVARHCGTEHREIVVSPTEFAEQLDAIVFHLDEPYGGSLPSWFLFRAMAREVRVAISGLGADELFGNYGKWLDEPLPDDPSAAGRTRARAAALAMRVHGRFHGHYANDELKRARLFSPAFAEGCRDSSVHLAELRARSGSRDPRSIVPFVDWHIQLPHELLHMTDRLSMAHGLEVRPPFLDRELVDTVWALPPALRSPGAQPKRLLIDAVAPLLPPGLAQAPKQGFAFPLDGLLSGVLAARVSELLAPPRLRAQGIFRDDLLATLAAPRAAGRRDLTQPLWSVLLAQIWIEQFSAAGGGLG